MYFTKATVYFTMVPLEGVWHIMARRHGRWRVRWLSTLHSWSGGKEECRHSAFTVSFPPFYSAWDSCPWNTCIQGGSSHLNWAFLEPSLLLWEELSPRWFLVQLTIKNKHQSLPPSTWHLNTSLWIVMLYNLGPSHRIFSSSPNLNLCNTFRSPMSMPIIQYFGV